MPIDTDRELAAPHGRQLPPGRAAADRVDDGGADREHDEREYEERLAAREVDRAELRARDVDAGVPVSRPRVLEADVVGEQPECERRERQREATETQRRQRHDGPDERRDCSADHDAEQDRDAEVVGQLRAR